MIVCKSPAEIEKMRRAGHVVRQVLEAVRAMIAPGVSTMDLELAAEARIAAMGAKSAFKGVDNGYSKYKHVLCTSVNNEIIHGIPSQKRILQAGEIVSVDCGAILDGYYGDSAITVAVGEIDASAKRLLEVTEQSLYRAIEQVVPGNHVGDIGAAVQEHVEANGFSIVREFVGHGIGTHLHEEPQIPNWGTRGRGARLRDGMVLAIEPMVNAGRAESRVLADHWTAVTVDGSFSAHFEHSVAVTKNGPVILTA